MRESISDALCGSTVWVTYNACGAHKRCSRNPIFSSDVAHPTGRNLGLTSECISLYISRCQSAIMEILCFIVRIGNGVRPSVQHSRGDRDRWVKWHFTRWVTGARAPAAGVYIYCHVRADCRVQRPRKWVQGSLARVRRPECGTQYSLAFISCQG